MGIVSRRRRLEVAHPAAAARQIDLIEAAANHLRAFPMMGRGGRRAGTSELPVPGTPYVLVYRVKQESVQMLVILHGTRNWQE